MSANESLILSTNICQKIQLVLGDLFVKHFSNDD